MAWKFSSESSCPELVATLKGHKLAVLSLVVGAGRLYSGSKDETIRVRVMIHKILKLIPAFLNYRIVGLIEF